jgi:diaminohydroxyphosphoribosylaminopyrimidine deaminase/5-amino-6-(5-phosphoribosylamino)uracil reductase
LSSALDVDQEFMRRAIDLARKNLGRTRPNPSVGCLVVNNGRVVGQGATGVGGRPHAETLALADAGKLLSGATVYVSFEPCAHHGRTPPCAEALAQSCVKRVVIGCLDPYPPVRGRGVARLRRAGIKVTVGVLERECRQLNEGFITRVTKGRPFVLLKLALTFDGRIAAIDGDSRWISSPEARRLVHRWRAEFDAVMVGANTVIGDDPRLTCRVRPGRDPVRIVLDGSLRTSPEARVFRQRSSAPAILFTAADKVAQARARHAENQVEVVDAPMRDGKLELAAVMRELGRRGFLKVLVEGGAHLGASALAAKVVDRVAFFVAPKLLGGGLGALEGLNLGMAEAIRLNGLCARPVGADWLLEAQVACATRQRAAARQHADLA